MIEFFGFGIDFFIMIRFLFVRIFRICRFFIVIWWLFVCFVMCIFLNICVGYEYVLMEFGVCRWLCCLCVDWFILLNLWCFMIFWKFFFLDVLIILMNLFFLKRFILIIFLRLSVVLKFLNFINFDFGVVFVFLKWFFSVFGVFFFLCFLNLSWIVLYLFLFCVLICVII